MACNCDTLRAEVMSQRELMTEWFQTLMIEIGAAKAELVELIKAKTFNVGEQLKTIDQPLTGQQTSIAEPISASAFLESINSPLQCSDAVSVSNPVPLSLEPTRNPAMEPAPDDVIRKELISPKIESTTEELSVEFNLTQNEHSDETFGEQAKATSGLIQFCSVGSANIDAAVKNESVSVQKPFACDQCDFRTRRKDNLQSHQKTHTGKKPWQCDLCDFKSVWRSTINNHKFIVHAREKPKKCEFCDFRCIQNTQLIRHKRRHTGDRKPFACDQCEFTAHSRFEVKLHQRRHTGEKPFVCDKCDFRTGLKVSLQNHQRIHTGEKPFQCDLCNYRAVSKPVMYYHRKNKHQPQV